MVRYGPKVKHRVFFITTRPKSNDDQVLTLLNYIRAILLSVRPAVCLSVTLCSRIKMVHARITKSSLLAAPKTLVFCDEILSP